MIPATKVLKKTRNNATNKLRINYESTYMSQLWAGGPVIPGLLRPARVKYCRNICRVVTATQFTTVMNTISIYGWACTSLTERWQVLFSRYS